PKTAVTAAACADDDARAIGAADLAPESRADVRFAQARGAGRIACAGDVEARGSAGAGAGTTFRTCAGDAGDGALGHHRPTGTAAGLDCPAASGPANGPAAYGRRCAAGAGHFADRGAAALGGAFGALRP